ncbi:hypothetical protein [Alicycliphilus denitrificans]|uniref:Uncharacterized protein n=1 Tax=Alicycliphilus denitrificans (strain DSM 14773 / CIP 107495 / K601) TaxID=596154 RepID=F4GFF1_ALIDK|nr:hypothetical protein [Alicycliphilus denitrificans]ADV00689.1 hypothetical protein Alide_2962 [Alicycliphilus denitrificans BC]AEB83883.1 hypothetical protein Alide2_1485 [Alicycliphilus denitrificans K601]
MHGRMALALAALGLAEDGMHLIGSSAAEFERQVAHEIAVNRKLVQELQITAD